MQKSPILRILALALMVIVITSLCATAFAKYATIPYGQKSDAVRVMQNALKEQGYYKGSVDGRFGPLTKQAVIAFQNAVGIKADGKPGDKTLTALYNGGSTAVNKVDLNKAGTMQIKDSASIHYGATGDRVRSLQKALKAAGYFNGTVDGKFGELTELAVRKFQNANGLKADGIAGKKTLAALNGRQSTENVSSSFLLDIGSKGPTVSSAQQKLVAKGFFPRNGLPLDTYGTYGAATADMVSWWKEDNGFGPGGTLSEEQYNALILSK
jgi:peptidoglycan hydrolase-like protein with peptidoglycan-binding domain